MFAEITFPFMREIEYVLSLLILSNDKGKTMRENQFQARLIKDLKKIFPDCIIMKNDANYIQGIPDLLILYGNKWACLECKKSSKAKHQPNQEYYVELMNEMSFARFISPENKEEVIGELQQTFQS